MFVLIFSRIMSYPGDMWDGTIIMISVGLGVNGLA